MRIRAVATETGTGALGRIVCGRAGVAIAFLWGLAEATCFFIVPDVFLTFVALVRLGPALRANLAALAGALLGGAVMGGLGSHSPDAVRDLLVTLPGIDPALIADVRDQLAHHGLSALLLGPLRGVPYKLYAVEWGAQHGALLPFLLVSIPARAVRFVLATLLARGIAIAITRRGGRRLVVAWTIFWVGFYTFYFSRMGW